MPQRKKSEKSEEFSLSVDEWPSIKQELLSLEFEHPFRWNLANLKKPIYPKNLLEKIAREPTETGMKIEYDFQLEYLMLYVLLSYSYVNGTNENKPRNILKALESLEIGEAKLIAVRNNSPDVGMYVEALLHIMRSMKAYLSLMKENVSASELNITMSAIPRMDKMNKKNLAALHGLRAIFYGEFGCLGFKAALNFLSKATEIDSKEAAWYYLRGKYIRMVRHAEHFQSPPGDAEIRYVEQALSMNENNGSYALYAADMYREKAIKSQNRQNCIELNNKKAYILYKKSAQLKPKHSETLFRCAKGIMRLKGTYRDTKLAKELFKKGFELDPESSFGHHGMAQYYENVGGKDWRNEAMKHLKFCEEQKNFPAVMDLTRLEYNLHGESINIVERLERLLEVYRHRPLKCQIFARLSSYHLLFLSDLYKACQYVSYIGQLNGNYECIKRHIPLYRSFKAPEAIDLRAMLMEEIEKAIKKSQLRINQNAKVKKTVTKKKQRLVVEETPVDPKTQYLEAFLNHLSNPSRESIPEPPKDLQIQFATMKLEVTRISDAVVKEEECENLPNNEKAAKEITYNASETVR